MELNEKTLAQYFDGELSDKNAAKVKQLLSSSPDSAQTLHKLETVSSYIQIMQTEQLDNISFDGFDKRILNEIRGEKSPVSWSEKASIWVHEFFEHKKTIWIPTASLAGAACAALLAFGLNSQQPIPTMPSGSSQETWQASSNTSTSSTVVVTAPKKVNATAYNISLNDGQSIGVVWIDE